MYQYPPTRSCAAHAVWCKNVSSLPDLLGQQQTARFPRLERYDHSFFWYGRGVHWYGSLMSLTGYAHSRSDDTDGPQFS